MIAQQMINSSTFSSESFSGYRVFLFIDYNNIPNVTGFWFVIPFAVVFVITKSKLPESLKQRVDMMPTPLSPVTASWHHDNPPFSVALLMSPDAHLTNMD